MTVAIERFIEELAYERDPERKGVLAAIVRLLRSEPIHAPADGSMRLHTVSALAAEAQMDRFHFASAERGRHYALARRYLAAAKQPEAAPATEQRLRDENQRLAAEVERVKAERDIAQRTVEVLARALRVTTAERERERKAVSRGLRTVP